MVSTKLVAVHSQTIAPNQRSEPVRTVSTSCTGSRRVAATSGGSRRRTFDTVSIGGTDEVDPARGRVSWISPVARALIRSREGDTVTLQTPVGEEQLEVLEIRYEELS